MLKPKTRLSFKIGIYVFSLLVLVAYSLVLFFKDNWSKMGIVISITITIMDLFNFILFASSMISSSASLCLMLFLNRILLICFGQGYWIYGAMILYLAYGFTFVLKIASKMFPLENEIVIREAALKDILKSKNKL